MSANARSLSDAQPGLFDSAADLLGKAGTKSNDKSATRSKRKFAIGAALARSSAAAQTPATPAPTPAAAAAASPQMGRNTLMQQRAHLLLSARERVFGLVLAFAALALVAMVQIVWLGMDKAGSSVSRFSNTLVPARGEITDRNGAALASEYPARSLYFYPQAMKDGGAPLVRSPEEVARELKAIFPDLNEKRAVRILKSGESGYLLRRILPEQANRVWALGEVAVQTPGEMGRHYPQGKLAAHILGRVIENDDGQNVGAFGMEKALNAQLSDETLRANPVPLSIDVRVQGALEDEMGRGMKLAQAKGAAGIVLDVDTGEVLAMASMPDFDPNKISQEDADNTTNRVSYLTGELGSVFKPLTVAAAIDAGVVRDLSASWNARPVEVANRSFKDFEDKGDRLNIPQALAYSSNTVTMRVADELGGEQLRKVMLDLGMNVAPEIELQARGRPYWPKGKWSQLTTMTVGYGHGLSVTPLHLANAYAAMVNGGIFRPATLRKVEPGKANPGKRVFKASTSHRMRQLLRMVAIYGTGRKADATGFRVGGKTGSAEKLVNGRYSKTKLISTFASAFPMDRPRYVVVVALDEPRITQAIKGRTAAWNAAPIVGNLIRRAGPMLGVRPDNTRDVDISDLKYLVEGRK
ncbi:MAG: penicillin-binding protein 2 [Erythrobacter sp.]